MKTKKHNITSALRNIRTARKKIKLLTERVELLEDAIGGCQKTFKAWTKSALRHSGK